MTTEHLYKRIIGYVDELNQDIGQLVAFVEQEMDERRYESLPSAGGRISWSLSSAINRSTAWRLSNAIRFFIPRKVTKSEHSVFYLIHLETKSAFDFPPVLCCRVAHEALTESEIYQARNVFNTALLATLVYRRSQWKSLRLENGWCIAEPNSQSAVQELRGYILNLFDIDSRQRALENIVIPLTSGDDLDLDAALTVHKYLFPELSPE